MSRLRTFILGQRGCTNVRQGSETRSEARNSCIGVSSANLSYPLERGIVGEALLKIIEGKNELGKVRTSRAWALKPSIISAHSTWLLTTVIIRRPCFGPSHFQWLALHDGEDNDYKQGQWIIELTRKRDSESAEE